MAAAAEPKVCNPVLELFTALRQASWKITGHRLSQLTSPVPFKFLGTILIR
jgi:hypothetical protein